MSKNLIIGAIAIFIIIVAAFFVLGNKTNTGDVVSNGDFSKLVLKVDIPCEGHAPLIIQELGKLEGILKVSFNSPYFYVEYEGSVITEAEILNAEIFDEFPARIV